jgi:hypothetical protein
MSTRRIKVKVPVISLRGDDQIVDLVIGGRLFHLKSADTDNARALAVALQAATSVTLELDENPRFPAPKEEA